MVQEVGPHGSKLHAKGIGSYWPLLVMFFFRAVFLSYNRFIWILKFVRIDSIVDYGRRIQLILKSVLINFICFSILDDLSGLDRKEFLILVEVFNFFASLQESGDLFLNLVSDFFFFIIRFLREKSTSLLP